MLNGFSFTLQLGFSQLKTLPYMPMLTQIIISGLLLLMTTWIYGRSRFQCDLQFMLGKTISTFKIFTICFITPFVIAVALVNSI